MRGREEVQTITSGNLAFRYRNEQLKQFWVSTRHFFIFSFEGFAKKTFPNHAINRAESSS